MSAAFTTNARDTLLSSSANAYLNKSAEEKYKDFCSVDPFYGKVSDALLNSLDVIKYALTTGMIDQFIPEDLEGATYTCRFSGEYTYLNADENKWERRTLDNETAFTIPSNSIVFLGIETKFQLPVYMVARFNLKVSNAYKGLLLGTGPIVDPGFVGKLNIPLHNLTSNEYVIKKDAKLICVEFTKLSKNENWRLHGSTPLQKMANSLDFSGITYGQQEIPRDRDANAYFTKALTGDCQFRKIRDANEKTDIISVGSSIPEAIKKSEENAKNSEHEATQAKESAKKSETTIRRFSLFGGIAAVLAVASIVVMIVTMNNDIHSRIDNILTSETVPIEDYIELKQENESLQRIIEELLDRIERIERNSETQTP